MGFGGAQGMITSLKNNSRRNKREAFSTRTGESDKESQGIKIEPVSEKALEEIRTKIQKQNRISTTLNIVAITISIVITIWLLF